MHAIVCSRDWAPRNNGHRGLKKSKTVQSLYIEASALIPSPIQDSCNCKALRGVPRRGFLIGNSMTRATSKQVAVGPQGSKMVDEKEMASRQLAGELNEQALVIS